jgi:hypothetical protein
MAIPTTPISGAQFVYLQNNISQQADALPVVADIAESGLNYVVVLNITIPELDLLTPFYVQYVSMSQLDTINNFSQVVTALNQHVVNRGTTLLPGDTLSERLNRWFDNNGFGVGLLNVTQTYQRLSSGVGYLIENQYVEP